MTRGADSPPGAPGPGPRAKPPAPPRRVDTDALTRSAGRGAMWRIGGGTWMTLVRLAASTVLARLLMPEHFGILGMAILARALVQRLGAVGMSTGVIAKKDVTSDDLCTCFWSMLLVKSVLFVAAFAGAPLAAMYFKEPQVTWVFRAACATFLISSVSTISSALLRKQLQFGRLVGVEMAAVVLESGAAITLAATTDLGHWALVLAMLAAGTFQHLATFCVKPWWPKLRFSKASFRYQFRFGAYGLASGIANYVDLNVDYLVIGRVLGAASLGLYEFAYRIPHMIHQRITRTARAVFFPTLAQVQDRPDLVARGFLKAARLSGLITWPLLAGLAAAALPIVKVMWGDRWLPVVPALRILCLASALNAAGGASGAVFLALQRPDLPFKLQVIRSVIALALVVPLGMLFGMVGAAVAMSVTALFFFYVAWRATRLCGVPYRHVLACLVPAGVSAAACGGGAWAACAGAIHFALPTPLVLSISVLAGALACLVVMAFPLRASLLELLSVLRISAGGRGARPSPAPGPRDEEGTR